MTGKGLDGCHRRTLHREVRAEGVPKNMDSLLRQTRAPSCPTHADFQHSYWGDNYRRLAQIRQEYDPDGLFFVHNGVGSEQWSADGFTRRL